MTSDQTRDAAAELIRTGHAILHLLPGVRPGVVVAVSPPGSQQGTTAVDQTPHHTGTDGSPPGATPSSSGPLDLKTCLDHFADAALDSARSTVR
jgi:hypothetical protein